MKRQIVNINRDLCNGCGECIPNCMEGALQIIDGKATLVSELMCDGLGACLGHCPLGAINIEEREALPYDEAAVMSEIISQGKNVVIAHLLHLQDHNQDEYLEQGVQYLIENSDNLNFDSQEVITKVFQPKQQLNMKEFHLAENQHQHGGGCPGSKSMSFNQNPTNESTSTEQASELTQWPVQMHLINPMASYFQNADLLIAADCVAFSLGNFHSKFLKGKKLAIACPKLDSNMEVYVEKLVRLINDAKVNTIHVMIMEVPCCGGLSSMIQRAMQQASRKVPVKQIVVSVQGEIIEEEWM